MTIREATYSETQKILKYAPSVLKEASVGYYEPRGDTARQLASSFLIGGGYYIVHTENNVIQGWVGVGEIFDNYSNEKIGFIPEIYVMPNDRKKGIADKLCKEVFRKLKESGHNKVQLNVFSGNHAKDLYHKLGFQDVSTIMEKGLDGDDL